MSDDDGRVGHIGAIVLLLVIAGAVIVFLGPILLEWGLS